MYLLYAILLLSVILAIIIAVIVKNVPWATNTSIAAASILFSLLLLSILLDLKFYYDHGSPFSEKSLKGFQKPVTDLDLKRVELDDDIVPLVEGRFSSFTLQCSDNCRLEAIGDGTGTLEMSSSDGRDAWVELSLNATGVHDMRGFFQGMFTVQVRNDPGCEASLTTFEQDGDHAYTVPWAHVPDDAPWHVMSGFFFKDTHPNGQFIDRHLDEDFRIRISASSSLCLQYPTLSLVKVHIPYPYTDKGDILAEKFPETRNSAQYETINREPLENSYRILFVGGSTTYGYGTGCATSYPQLFKGILKSRVAHKDGLDIDAINVGQMGNTTLSILYQYDRSEYIEDWSGFYHLYVPTLSSNFTIKDLKPDLVFLAPVYNDQIYSSIYKRHFKQYTGKPFAKESDKNETFLDKFFQHFKGSNAIFYYFEVAYFNFKYTENYTSEEELINIEHRLSIYIEKLLSDGAEVVLLSFPYMEHDYKYMHVNDNKIFSRLSKKYNVLHFDLTTNNAEGGKSFWYDYIHPNGIGYNDYAEALFNYLFFSQPDQQTALRKFRKQFTLKYDHEVTPATQ